MYLIFAYKNYYPFGGYGDFKCASNDRDYVNNAITKYLKEYDVVDVCKIKNGTLILIADITCGEWLIGRCGGREIEAYGSYITIFDDDDRARMS